MLDVEQAERYRAIGIGVDDVGMGEHPAVLVVDLQIAFTEGTLATEATPRILQNVHLLLEGARSAGIPIFYVHVVYDDPSEAGIVWSTKCPRMAACLRGDPLVRIHPAIEPKRGDRVIEKKRASAFFRTSLHDELQELGVDSLIICGTSTGGCVRASAVDAAQLDYRVTVVQDCVEDRDGASHRASLLDIRAKYGDVVPLARVRKQLASGGTR
jgi:nicotinamidase-related amidase